MERYCSAPHCSALATHGAPGMPVCMCMRHAPSHYVDHSPDVGEMVATDMIQIHPALAEVLPELVNKINAEIDAIIDRMPTMAETLRRVNALNGPDKVAAYLDVAAMFAALYTIHIATIDADTRH